MSLKKGLMNTFGGKEVTSMARIDDGHTYAFRQYRHLLVFTRYMDHDEKTRVKYHTTFAFSKPELSDDDLANLYHMTRMMRDEELADINAERVRGCGSGRCTLPPLPRLAYVNGNYKVVQSQKQRVYLETNTKVDFNFSDIEKLVENIQEKWEF